MKIQKRLTRSSSTISSTMDEQVVQAQALSMNFFDCIQHFSVRIKRSCKAGIRLF